MPESQAGFEFEIGGKRLALEAGLNYSNLGGQTLWQRYLGAGFKVLEIPAVLGIPEKIEIPEVLGIRFDATAYYNDVYHDSNYLATTSTTNIELVGDGPFRFPISRTTVTTTEHSIFGKDQYLDGSVTATFNTIGKNWPINYFATGTFGSQTFIKITHDKKNHGIHRNYSTFPSECTRS